VILDLSSIIPGIAFTLYILFAVFGLYHQKRERIRWPFLAYMLAMALWGFGSFMMHADTGILTPLFWNRFMMAGMLSGPITIYHSLLNLSEIKKKQYYYLVYLGYCFFIFLIFLNFQGSIVEDAGFRDGHFYYVLGSAVWIAYALSYSFLLLGIFIILREIKRTDRVDLKKKLLLPLIGAIVLLVGILGNLHEPIGRYPIDLFAATINAALLFYAIYKYHLVHYSAIVLRIILHIIIGIIFSFLFIGMVWIIFPKSAIPFEGYSYLIALGLGIAVAFIFQPLLKGTLNVVEKVFLGKRLEYIRSLRTFASSLTSITDLNHLGELTIQKIMETFAVDWAFLVILDYKTRKYRIVKEHGLEIMDASTETEDIIFSKESPFSSLIQKNNKVLLRQNGNTGMSIALPPDNRTVYPSLILPLLFKERVNGAIVLGQREDKDYYNQYDLEALEILAGQCSVSLENAISFERLKNQQKRLQNLNNELVISRNKLEAFFDGITNPISIQDIHFNIVTVNFATTKYVQKSYDEIIGKKCYRIFFNKDKPCEYCMAPDCFHTMLSFNTEVTNKDMGVIFSIQFYPINMPAGTDRLILEFFQDITHQKKLQEELVQSEKLAGIGTLASGIAHEINNPLGGIIGTAELILNDIEDNSKLQEFTNDIIQYAENAAEVIKELTDYSRQDVKKQEPVHVPEVLESALKLAMRGMDFKEVNVSKKYKEVPSIKANTNELQQVFLNLIINAVQAMPYGGTLRLQCYQDDGKAIILIEDTGTGIVATHLENIFTPFFTTKDPGKGSGLGLSITHQLVTTMGGRINVTSKHQEGTRFTITFPVNDREKQKIRFAHATTPEMIDDVFYIQRKILIGEKGYKEETIHRSIDELAYHIIAYRGLQPVGTVSCIAPDVAARFPIEDNFPLAGMIENKRCLEIDRLAVIKESRGSIIPLGLMTLAYLYGKSLQVERLFLDVFSDEKKHIHMYKKLGFTEIGEYKKPLPVTVMMLDQISDYEKEEARLDHFVKPLMKRLMLYLDYEEEEKATILRIMNEMISEPGNYRKL